MSYSCVLIGSHSKRITIVCDKVAADMGIKTRVENKIEDFLLALQENDYTAIIFDMDIKEIQAVKTVRLIRRMRPKIPLIVLGEKIEKEFGGRILNEGVFQLLMSPPSQENLHSALLAVSTFTDKSFH